MCVRLIATGALVVVMSSGVAVGELLVADGFSGSVINAARWSVYDDPDGGSLTQHNRLYWNKAGSTSWTGHGVSTVSDFDGYGGVYVVEADYSAVDWQTKSEGEAGTGLLVRHVAAPRDTSHYGYPLNSIEIRLFSGEIYYRTAQGGTVNITTRDTIQGNKPAGSHNDVFWENQTGSVHIRVEIDTMARRVKCWLDSDSTTYSEGSFTAAAWTSILGGTGRFRLEEYRSWSGTSAYVEHRMDNWRLSVGDAPDRIQYVALGDSYSSGEGAGSYRQETAVNCHRSRRAHSQAGPGAPPAALFPSVSRQPFLACSGATTDQVVNYGFLNDPLKDQVSQLDRLSALPDEPDLITMTIGGNDAGFAYILTHCSVFPSCMQYPAPDDPEGRTNLEFVEDFLADEIAARLELTFTQVRSVASSASIMVLGYPYLFPEDPDDRDCSELACVKWQPGSGCVPFMSLSPDEQGDLRTLTDAMNAAIQAAATASGVHYVSPNGVDGVSFEGHEICGPLGTWIWDNSAGQKVEWFHPSEIGQQGYANLIDQYILMWLLDGRPTTAAGLPANRDTDPSAAQRRPTTSAVVGELLVEAVAAPSCPWTDALALGGQARVIGDGFAGSTAVHLLVSGGEGVTADLGSVVSASSGELDEEITLPSDPLLEGPAVIQAAGAGPSGEHVVLMGGLVLAASLSTDGDFDGVADVCDNCLGMSNPLQDDADADGFGDVCDQCPADPQNDVDGDGLCAVDDPCPLDPDNRVDGNGICVDSNPWIFFDGFESGDTSGWG